MWLLRLHLSRSYHACCSRKGPSQPMNPSFHLKVANVPTHCFWMSFCRTAGRLHTRWSLYATIATSRWRKWVKWEEVVTLEQPRSQFFEYPVARVIPIHAEMRGCPRSRSWSSEVRPSIGPQQRLNFETEGICCRGNGRIGGLL